MALITTTFTVDASGVLIADVIPPRDRLRWEAEIFIEGTFGGGTVTLFASRNNGSTLTAIRDLTGNAYSTTTADVVPVSFAGRNATPIRIYATLAGSTSPNLTINVVSNVG